MRLRPGRLLPALVLSLVAGDLPLHGASPADPAHLVADLVTSPFEGSAEATVLGRFGDHAFFSILDPARVRSLWRTDGTTAGTEEVAELCPAGCGLWVDHLAATVDGFFFATEDGSSDGQVTLWFSDGTREGTEALVSFTAFDGPERAFAASEDSLYFSATSPSLGIELWTSDGTAEGTGLLSDVCPGTCSSTPSQLAPFDDRVAFIASAPEGGFQGWIADGTSGDLVRLQELCGECESTLGPRAHGGRIYFTVIPKDGGSLPWASDGTAAGTRPLLPESLASSERGINQSFEVEGTVYLVLGGPFGEPHLWRTDGTPEGTEPALDVFDGLRAWQFPHFAPPTPGGGLFFVAGSLPGDTLYFARPSTGEAREVLGPIAISFFAPPTTLGESLVFVASREVGPAEGEEPWVSDGTAAGTRLLRDIEPGYLSSVPAGLTSLDGHAIFTAGVDAREVWRTDGTPAGTERLPVTRAASSSPAELTPFGGRLWFTALTDEGDPTATELWRTTEEGDRVERVAMEDGAAELTATSSGLYFVSYRPSSPFDFFANGQPMVVAGVDAAPERLADARFARGFTEGPGGLVFFTTFGLGEQLWVTDGTAAGTRLLVDVYPSWEDDCSQFSFPCPPAIARTAPTFPDRFTRVGEHLYFRAIHPETAPIPTLWRSDGTSEGTEWLVLAPAGVLDLVALGDRLVFSVAGNDADFEIWEVAPDGRVSISSSYFGFDDGRLTGADGVVYFLVEERQAGATGLFLYRTEGPLGTSRRVARLGGATQVADVGEMVAVGSRLYLTLRDPDLGTELWTSDGTAEGTGVIADLRPGPRSSSPTALTPHGPYLLFTADDGEHGREPWVSDGTARGTRRLGDVADGSGSSSPREYAVAGERIYFDADDRERGRELWALDLAALAGEEPEEVPGDAVGIVAPEYPGFRFWVRITAGGQVQPARRELLCLPETVCVSGALPGRSELFLRIVGPRPNGFLWPILVRFTTSRVEVWIEQVSTGALQHYVLDAATPGSSDLDGLFDRRGFQAD